MLWTCPAFGHDPRISDISGDELDNGPFRKRLKDVPLGAGMSARRRLRYSESERVGLGGRGAFEFELD